MTMLDCDMIRHMLDSGAALLDVRNTDEHHRGALPSSKNIPLPLLPVLAHDHLDKDQQVLVYCHSGARAVMAERILTGLGFNDVTNIGGMLHYQNCS